MMNNFSSMKLTVTDITPISESLNEYNVTGALNITSSMFNNSGRQLAKILIFLICILGILGNGLVIWLLGFHVKRTPFTTYVLNLSVADLGFLITDLIIFNPISPISGKNLLRSIIHFMYSASQCFLTVISVDRCLSVFFPLWYHIHRQKYLSAIVCALVWGISFLPPGLAYIAYKGEMKIYYSIIGYQVILNGFVCLPLIFISSLLLFSKVCSKIKQRKQRKPLIMILVTVLCFLIFYLPVNAGYICKYLFGIRIKMIPFSSDLCGSLNSSINPIVYGLIGRPRKGCSVKELSTILQGLFGGEDLSVHPGEQVEIALE